MDYQRLTIVSIPTLFFSICLIVGLSRFEPKTDPVIEDLSSDFKEIFQTVDENYVDTIDRKDLFLQAVDKIVSLDRYSELLLPEDLISFEENIDGDLVSIGIEYKKSVDCLVVTNILPFSSASGKLDVGDRIYFLDHKAVEEMSQDVVIKVLRGHLSSKLLVGLRHEGSEDLVEIELERKAIKKTPLRFAHMLDPESKIGYINIEIFNNYLAREFRAAYMALYQDQMRFLILDMRGNPGGGIESAIDFCDLFLAKGLIVATVGNEDGKRDQSVLFHAQAKEELPLVPIYIMLDRESASAAELTSSCLRDYQLAKIFGEKSFGKGEAQTTIPMESRVIGKYGIKITTAKFYTKSGFESQPKVSISGVGVSPDIKFDFGFQDTYLNRIRNYKKAWGFWSQGLARGKPLEEVQKSNFYFSDLAQYDAGLLALVKMIKEQELAH